MTRTDYFFAHPSIALGSTYYLHLDTVGHLAVATDDAIDTAKTASALTDSTGSTATPATTIRSQQRAEDCWDLSAMFASLDEWKTESEALVNEATKFQSHSGSLEKQKKLLQVLEQYRQLCQRSEKMYHYAFQYFCEDMGDAERQQLYNAAQQRGTHISTCISFFIPELLALPQTTLKKMATDPAYRDYHVFFSRLVRQKPHTLSVPLEQMMASAQEVHSVPSHTFNTLVDVDFSFPDVTTPQGPVALTHGSYHTLLKLKDRKVREQAYQTYLELFHNHRQTLTTLYSSSIKKDLMIANTRSYNSPRHAALYEDNVPEGLYDRLIASVRDSLPTLHTYYKVRSQLLKIDKLRLYDVHVSLAPDIAIDYPYLSGVDTIMDALQPLGTDYCSVLRSGLLGGWVDRYENSGKRSGAFAISTYREHPYILLNYQPTQLRSVFTVAHEAGHAMHSLYSAQHNPFLQYQYSIFAAEVASTVNEQLLYHHIKKTASSELSLYLVCEQLAELIATLYRQTMFAQFEHAANQQVAEHGGLVYPWVEETYQVLLKDYFGDSVVIAPFDAIEALRIPHFYRAYYVYQYATGISAAITIAHNLLNRTDYADRYLAFLKSGGSLFPLDALAAAGVDFATDKPFTIALSYFAQLVDALAQYV